MLHQVMKDATAGDPISGLKWTHKSLRKLERELARHGYAMSAPTISRLLRQQSYSMRVNRKRVAGKQSPGRDEQFAYIERNRKRFLRQGRPVISVDSKKKELIGRFRNPGREWQVIARDVNMYDFPSGADGKALPYGIYDVGRNEGFVVVGVSHDTAEFAVAAIRRWWKAVGRTTYGGQTHLLIEADCGGSNGNRCVMWLALLQRFADDTGLTITVTHYPTGASKWNPIEHRMFSFISKNWAGKPLESYETVLKYIRTTRTERGFRCRAQLDTRSYATKLKIAKTEIESLRLKRHKTFPIWNYTISPRIAKSAKL